jgi:hypothetical protein
MIIILQLQRAKKFTEEDGSFHFKKHKIYLFVQRFSAFCRNPRYDLCFVETTKARISEDIKRFQKNTTEK